MKGKAKGSKSERELVHMFWSNGWAPIRVAGSGSAPIPNPDVIAGNGLRRVAVEAKSSAKNAIYIEKENIKQIERFSLLFGAEPWIGVRFNNEKWYFLKTKGLKDSGKNFVITLDFAKEKGVLFETLISNQ
jgi:Holliday junction resolvase